MGSAPNSTRKKWGFIAKEEEGEAGGWKISKRKCRGTGGFWLN